MKFLDSTWIWDWCREHHYPLDEGTPHLTTRLVADSRLESRGQPLHAAAGDRVAASMLAQALVQQLGQWTECLIWVTASDIWENEEDWPRYYAWRAHFGELRSLGAAPGHAFTAADRQALEFVLAHAVECGWDTLVLPARNQRPTGVRLFTSHDEWTELQTLPANISPPAR